MADPNLPAFQTLSCVLTGFPAARVAPTLDPIGLSAQFLAWVTEQVGQPLMDQLLQKFNAIQPPTEQAVQQQIMADPTLGPLARRIIRLWYLGIWYFEEPPSPDSTPQNPNGVVVSANAYTGGLAWDAIQAHAMGYSEMHYGYWSTGPALPLPAPQFPPQPQNPGA
jgi:hypothetical protein